MPLQNQNDPISTLVPYKNSKALLAYYMGLFAIFPAVGLILGILAVIFGAQGLRAFRENPEVKGKVHAGIGIGCGLFGALFNAALITITLIALLSPKSTP